MWQHSGLMPRGKGKKINPDVALRKLKSSAEALEREKVRLALEAELAEKWQAGADDAKQERLQTAGGGVYTRDQIIQARKIGKKLDSIAKDKQSTEQIIRRPQALQEAQSVHEMRQTCKSLLNATMGRQIKSEIVLINAERMQYSEVKEVIELSQQERSEACSALWNFAFRGDVYRAIIADCNGIDVCMQILEELSKEGSGERNDFSSKLNRSAVAVLRSLCENKDLIPALIQRGVSQKFLDLLRDPTHSDQWGTILQVLAIIAQCDKTERNQLIKQNIVTYLLGDFNQHEWSANSVVKTGCEAVAFPSLQLIESLLTKDAIRTYVLESSRIVEIMSEILTVANLDNKAISCRIISKLCKSEVCKQALRRATLHHLVGDFFCLGISSIHIGSAGVALGALCNEDDLEIAEQCFPRITETLKGVISTNPKTDWEFCNIALPGVLRATRSFAEIDKVQDILSRQPHLAAIVSIISKPDSSDIAKADGCCILSYVSLQLRYHSVILAQNPNPLKVLFPLIKSGTVDQKANAARAVQNLSCNPDVRIHVANYVYSERIIVNKTTMQEVTFQWDALGAVSELVRRSASAECQGYGAGIIRNLAGLPLIRERILKKSKADPSLVHDLCDICRTGSLVSRLNAASALGNLSRTVEMASLICRAGVIPQLISFFSVTLNVSNDRKQHALNSECQQVALQTLGLLAHEESAVRQMVDFKVTDAIQKQLSSKSKSGREIAAKTLQNLTSFQESSGTFASHTPLIEAVFASIRRDAPQTQEHLVASIANLASNPSNLNKLINPLTSKAIVSLARRGSASVKSNAALIMKYAAASMDPAIQQSLFNAGAIPVLVHLLNEGKHVDGGAAERAAGALARLSAGDPNLAASCVHGRGIEACLSLVAEGCTRAKQQAAKCLIILAEDNQYCGLMLLQGGLGIARDLMNSTEDECARLGGILMGHISQHSLHSDKPTSLVERQVVAKLAVLKVKAESLRVQESVHAKDARPLHHRGRGGASASATDDDEDDDAALNGGPERLPDIIKLDGGSTKVAMYSSVRSTRGAKQVTFDAVSHVRRISLLPHLR